MRFLAPLPDIDAPSLLEARWVSIDSADVSGLFVYILWSDDPDTPLYIGASGSLLSRLGTHLGKDYWKIQRITFLRCPTIDDVCAIEAALIREYQPLWNSAGKNGKGYQPPRALQDRAS